MEVEQASAWPPREPGLPADTVFDEVSAALAPGEDDIAVARSRHDALVSAILRGLRPHCLDVDVRACGSWASGTAIGAATPIDLAVRVWSGPDAWQRDPALVASDVKRWLSYVMDEPIQATSRGLRIEFADGGPDVEIIRARLEWPVVDPVVHSDRVRARARALGDGRFVSTIRLLKALVRRRQRELGWRVASSYALERMALHHFRAPYNLPEGLAGFLTTATEAGGDFSRSAASDDPAGFRALCRDASATLDGVLKATADPTVVARELFGELPVADQPAAGCSAAAGSPPLPVNP